MTDRVADHPIDPMFLERWSPRAYDSKPISREDLLTVLEAGRWAPSSYNAQPWRFLFAHRDTPPWSTFLGLLVPFNQEWAKLASALVYIISKRDSPPGKDGVVKPSHTHSFDAGAAWAMMALQASKMGMRAHGMSGFDVERAAVELKVPASYRVEAVFALGRITDKSVLPESFRAKEEPNTRRPLIESIDEGVCTLES